MNTINIGIEFSEVPAGRYPDDGPFNGEAFREEYLKDIFINPQNYTLPVNIILDDNVEGYGSSFLNEAFGGIVRKGYATAETVKKSLNFIYSNEEFSYYKERIISYINEAVYGSEKNERK
jgi:STAS-like domain of unknown function (DUF4325)